MFGLLYFMYDTKVGREIIQKMDEARAEKWREWMYNHKMEDITNLWVCRNAFRWI